MKPRLIVAILVIAGLSLCAEAQEPSAAKADAQKFVKMIIGDKAKSQIYCDVVKLGEQIEETDPGDKKKADELYQQVDELTTKLGPEYFALMNELQDMDPDSEDGKEIARRSSRSTSCVQSSNEQLEKLCTSFFSASCGQWSCLLGPLYYGYMQGPYWRIIV